MLALLLAVLLVALPGCLAAPGPVNQQAISDVAAGKLTEAKASWWGFDPDDAIKCLQAAVNSKAPRLIVENMGKPWIVETINLVSNQEIVFEPGSEVLAKRGAFTATNACLFLAAGVENVTLHGKGASWRMWRADYDAAPYTKAEWRHCLTLRGCTNLKVYGLTLAESGGDGIYLGVGAGGKTNKGIIIKDVICESNYRQGISVITAEDLLIENTIMRNTAGTAPQAGIDFEPNNPSERLVNCVMRDCVTENNKGGGYAIYIPTLKGSSEPVSLRFENCKSVGDRYGLGLTTGNTPEEAVKGSIEFVGCSFESIATTPIAVGNKPVNGARLRFESCSILSPPATPTIAPITFSTRAGATEDIGGVEFRDFLISDPIQRNPMAFNDMAGSGVRVAQVTGNLILEKDGKRTDLKLTDELLAQWMPAVKVKRFPRYSLTGVKLQPLKPVAPGAVPFPSAARFRHKLSLAVYADKGAQVTFALRHDQVAKYAGKPVPVDVKTLAGTDVARVSAPFQQETEVSFVAPETGVFRIESDPGQNYMQLTRSSHPLHLLADKGPAPQFQTAGTFYFWVPAGVAEFGVRVLASGPGEAIRAALYDPAGGLIEEKDNLTNSYQFVVTRTDATRGEIYSLRLSKPTKENWEDYSLELQGIPPLLAPSPEAVLVPSVVGD